MRANKDLAKAKMQISVALGEQRAAVSRREADAPRTQQAEEATGQALGTKKPRAGGPGGVSRVYEARWRAGMR